VPLIDAALLSDLVLAVFAVGDPEVYQAYSDYDRDLESFPTPEVVEAYMATKLQESRSFFDFAIWYPSCQGQVEREKINLKPECCDGHTLRYSVGGWGIFHLQLDFKPSPKIDCRIAVNSEKRAVVWQAHYPEWLSVDAWNWPEVRKQERRLMRKLRSLALTGTSSAT
jgi:hypothetical protein